MNASFEQQRPSSLPPPRFSLATLMVMVTACAIASALIVGLGAHSAIGIIFLGLAIFAHVFGNALGTSLRAIGSRAADHSRPESAKLTPEDLSAADFAPASQLRDKSPLGWSIVAATMVGILLGGVGGYLGFAYWYGAEITSINLMLGAGAAAVLGGIWSFAGASLVRVFWSAWRQAVEKT